MAALDASWSGCSDRDGKMNRRAFSQIRAIFLSTLALVFVLTGCGGGGGGSSVAGLNIFIADDLSNTHDQIWVTVFEVEAKDSTGQHTTVFRSDEGVVVDLTNLNDGSAAKFMYLGTSAIASGEYSGMRVTLGRGLSLVPTGSSTAEACTFASAFDHGSDKSRLHLAFSGPETFSASDDLVIDFDLSQWTKTGSVVTPVIVKGSSTGLSDSSRHESDDYHGTISGLSGSGSNLAFKLTNTLGRSFVVETSDSTVVYNEDGTASPSLANGLRVEVTGTFSTLTDRLIATQIKIEDNSSGDDDKVEGVTQNFNEPALTFDVLAREVRGFLPSDPIVHVQISQSTRFFGSSGLPLTLTEIIASLNTGNFEVEVEGVYSSGTNTLTASKMKHHPENHHEAEAKGRASNMNTVAGTLDMSLVEWFGFAGSANAIISVTTSGGTQFEGENGESLSAVQFFAAVQDGSLVDARGTFADSTIAADRVRLKSGNGGVNNQDEVKGYVSSFNETAGTVTVSLTEWFGFSGSFGQSVKVQTNSNTAYRNPDGDDISKAAFFGALSNGMVVDAEGSFESGVLTAKRSRLKD